MIDLGFKPKYWDSPMLATSDSENDEAPEKKEPPTCYPQLCINDDAARELMKLGLRTDDKITFTVTARIVEVEDRAARNSEYGGEREAGCSVELEVQSIDAPKKIGEESGEDDSAETAVDNFVKSKKGQDAKK